MYPKLYHTRTPFPKAETCLLVQISQLSNSTFLFFFFLQLPSIFACRSVIIIAIIIKSGVDDAISSLNLCANLRRNLKNGYVVNATDVTGCDGIFAAPTF